MHDQVGPAPTWLGFGLGIERLLRVVECGSHPQVRRRAAGVLQVSNPTALCRALGLGACRRLQAALKRLCRHAVLVLSLALVALPRCINTLCTSCAGEVRYPTPSQLPSSRRLGLVRKIYAGPPVPPVGPPAHQPRGPSGSPAPPIPVPGAQQGPFARASAPYTAAAPGPSSGSPLAGGLSSALQGRPMAPVVQPVPYAPYNKARVAVLFASGQCCVFDLDSTLKLRATPASATAVQRAGFRAVLDAAWLPLGWPEGDGGCTAGGGGVSLLTVVSDEGTVSVLDVAGVSTGSAAQQQQQQQGGGGPTGTGAGSAAAAAPEVGKPPRPSSGTIAGATTAAAGPTGAAGGSAVAAGATGAVPGPGAGSLPHGSRRYAMGGVSARTLALRTALAPSPHPPAPKPHDTAGPDLLGGEVRDAAAATRFHTGEFGGTPASGDKQALQQQHQESHVAGLDGADGSSSPSGVRVCLEQAPSMGSCLLLPRPWAMLLRLLLQLGLSQEALRYLCGPHTPGARCRASLPNEPWPGACPCG